MCIEAWSLNLLNRGSSSSRSCCIAGVDGTGRRYRAGRCGSRRRSLNTLSLEWCRLADGAGVTSHGAGGYASLGHFSANSTGSLSDNLSPLSRGLRCVCFELNFMAHGETLTKLARHVLALDVEFLATDSANHAVGQVQGHLRHGVLGEVIISLELVKELGGRDNVVVRVIRAHDLALALKRARNKGLCCAVVLVGELNLRHGPCGRRWVDEDGVVALDEAVPLKVKWYALCVSDHVSVRSLGVLSLRVHNLHELAHALLDGLDDVCLELGEGVLNANQILSVVVLLLDLLVQAVHDTTLKNVRVVPSLHAAAVGVEDSRVLAEQLNVLLSMGSRLVNGLTALAGALGQLLALVLDLSVQALEDGQNGALELLCCFVVLVGDALTIGLATYTATRQGNVLGCLNGCFQTCLRYRRATGRSGGLASRGP